MRWEESIVKIRWNEEINWVGHVGLGNGKSKWKETSWKVLVYKYPMGLFYFVFVFFF